jgi:hypothetical protein
MGGSKVVESHIQVNQWFSEVDHNDRLKCYLLGFMHDNWPQSVIMIPTQHWCKITIVT